MIRIAAFAHPRAPEVARTLEVPVGLLDRARAAQALGPGERAEAPLALDQRVAGTRSVALDAHAHVAEQAKRRLALARIERVATLVARVHHFPLGRRRAVVEHRLAHELDLHLPPGALDHAHQ